MLKSKLLISLFAISFIAITLQAQTHKRYRYDNGRWIVEIIPDSIPADAIDDSIKVDTMVMDSLDLGPMTLCADTTIDVSGLVLPKIIFLPPVFTSYDMHTGTDTTTVATAQPVAIGPMAWVENGVSRDKRRRVFMQQFMIDNPNLVNHNINTLPEAPKKYITFVDPSSERIIIREQKVSTETIKKEVDAVEIEKKHWLHDFNGLIQFSQAYNSPNWYQGGNNNLNLLIQGVYNVKLNQAFHPNLLFENTIQYKLGLNSAPDDSLRNYSISEDLLQINTKFGIKAAKRWYYSATLQFKTQLLNNYQKNTTNLSAAFLAPGELNLGLGMTYEYKSPNGKLSAKASISPLSYNLKICTNEEINETQFGITEGRNTESQYGSNLDCTLNWKLAHNISLSSRLTAFTNYSYVQGDLENTLSFAVNRYLSTQIYVHLRYDSTTSRHEDSKWHKWQLREVLSFGFSYNFGTV